MECPSCHHTKPSFYGSKNRRNLYLCQQCTLIYVVPVPGPSSLAIDHCSDNQTLLHTRKLKSKQCRATKRIWGLKRLCKGKRFIDTSCNAGFAVEAARSLGLDALGIDQNRNNIEFARRQYPQTQFQSIAAETLAAQGERFDIVYCCKVIEHVADPRRYFDTLYRLLCDGGVLFISTPDVAHPTVKNNPLAMRAPEQLRYFSKPALKHLLASHHFSSINFRPSFKPTIKVLAQK